MRIFNLLSRYCDKVILAYNFTLVKLINIIIILVYLMKVGDEIESLRCIYKGN